MPTVGTKFYRFSKRVVDGKVVGDGWKPWKQHRGRGINIIQSAAQTGKVLDWLSLARSWPKFAVPAVQGKFSFATAFDLGVDLAGLAIPFGPDAISLCTNLAQGFYHAPWKGLFEMIDELLETPMFTGWVYVLVGLVIAMLYGWLWYKPDFLSPNSWLYRYIYNRWYAWQPKRLKNSGRLTDKQMKNYAVRGIVLGVFIIVIGIVIMTLNWLCHLQQQSWPRPDGGQAAWDPAPAGWWDLVGWVKHR